MNFKFELKRLKRAKVRGKCISMYFIAKAGNFLLLLYNCEKRVYFKFETEYKTRHNHEIRSIFIFQ